MKSLIRAGESEKLLHQHGMSTPSHTEESTGGEQKLIKNCQSDPFLEMISPNGNETDTDSGEIKAKIKAVRERKVSAIARFTGMLRRATAFTVEIKDQDGLIKPAFQAIPSDPGDGGVCRMEDSSKYIFRMCSRGRLEVVIRLLDADPRKLTVVDANKRTPLHHAAYHGKIGVVDLLLERGADINCVDKNGETPLISAAKNGQSEAVGHLVARGAQVDHLNDSGWSVLHIAVQKDKPDVIRALGKFSTVNMCTVGKKGIPPISTAAAMERPECAEALIENGAKLCQTCDNGFYPIHIAAKNASRKTMAVLLAHGEKMGCTKENMLSFGDMEKNSPLHSAVNSGDLNCVKLLLENGALVVSRQDDRATSLHLAAAHGSLEIVQLLYEAHKQQCRDAPKRLSPEDILLMEDSQGQTPLHKAAMFDHPHLVDYLLEIGSDINAHDSQRRTPLLLAAIRGGATTIRCLLQHKADLWGRINTVTRLLASSVGAHIINEADGEGLTALHLACQNGHNKVVQLLLHKGALLHKDYMGRTPLHVAATNGYTHTTKLLLEFHGNLLNQVDREGNSALHYASAANQASVVGLLLDEGAEYCPNLESMTSMDICIDRRHAESAIMHVQSDRWEALLMVRSKKYICPLLGLIQYLPEVHKLTLDRCITTATCDSQNEDYWIKYNYVPLQASMKDIEGIKQDPNMKHLMTAVKPLLAVNKMVEHRRVDLLSHPVCLNYLQMKWQAYGFAFHSFNLALYFLFVACLTWIIARLDPRYIAIKGHFVLADNTSEHMHDHSQWREQKNTTAHADDWDMDIWMFSSKRDMGQCMPMLLVTITLFLSVFKEFCQMYQQRLEYLADKSNFIEWALYISASIFVLPMMFFGNLSGFQWQCGAIAVFLAWFHLLFYLSRLNSLGIYVIMFLQILITVVRVALLFSILFIAFGFAFHILTANHPFIGHGNLKVAGTMRAERPTNPDSILSIVNSVVMMMGDWNFVQTYAIPYVDNQLYYPTLNFAFLILFIIIMPILFINLLIGLAVGDIEMVLQNAKLKRLAMQVQYHTDLERRWIPMCLLKRLDQTEQIVYPNQKYCGLGKSTLCKMMSALSANNNDLFTSSVDFNERKQRETGTKIILEFAKSKKKAREMQSLIEKQHELLRLVVQKMEIVAEADQYDEGADPTDVDLCGYNKAPVSQEYY